MTIGEPPSPERPHVEPGPTPEERAQMEREEAYARRIWPELADARYGPEPSPEETQAQLEALKDEEHAIRKVLESITQITSDAVENKREAREKAEKVAELKEALNQMRVRETTLRTRLIRINMRNQPRRRR
jgi:predicted RNase H-like nuclease (RuvC/YqgF family)